MLCSVGTKISYGDRNHTIEGGQLDVTTGVLEFVNSYPWIYRGSVNVTEKRITGHCGSEPDLLHEFTVVFVSSGH